MQGGGVNCKKMIMTNTASVFIFLYSANSKGHNSKENYRTQKLISFLCFYS